MAHLNDHAARFRKGLSNPFAANDGFVWCPTCEQYVDHETQGRHKGSTYAYKRTCCRCGRVLARGVFDNVVVLTGQPLPKPALDWTQQPGADRR